VPHTALTVRTWAAAQRKFMDLGGSAENQGDLRSVVLHKMTLSAHKSTFPIALGVRLTGVDDSAYSQTGGLLLHFESNLFYVRVAKRVCPCAQRATR